MSVSTGRTGEEGGRGEEKTPPIPVATEAWDDLDPQPSTEWDDHQHYHQVTAADHTTPLHVLHTSSLQTGSPVAPLPPDSVDPGSVDQMWDSESENKASQPLFPEAFSEGTAATPPLPTSVPVATTLSLAGGLPLPGLPTASCAQPTALTAPTPALPRQPTPGSSRYHLTLCVHVAGDDYCIFPSHHPGPVEFQTSSGMSTSHSSRHHSRHKRLARSQIPSQPVEMPKGTYPEVHVYTHLPYPSHAT